MGRLARYLSGIYAARLLVVTFAMVVLMGVLDALSNADLLPDDSGFSDSMWYMALRLPVLFDRVLPFALLLASMITYFTLIRRNELVPIWGAGLSVFGQVRALAPASLLAGLIAAVIANTTIPPTQRALEDWLGPEVLRADDRAPDTLWLAEDRWLIEVAGMNGDVLHGVTMFERGDDHKIVAVSHAMSAVVDQGGWLLLGTTQTRFDDQPPAPPKTWRSSFDPDTLQQLMSEPRQLPVTTLWKLSQLKRSGNKPSSAYLVWLYNRLALPLISLGFMMLALSLMQRFGRNNRAELTMVLGMILGFVYMVIDGIFKSLAESGAVNAASATAIPIGGLFAVGIGFSLYRSVRT